MNADDQSDDEKDDLTEKIIGCAFKVANTLGTGFLEKVYENALVHELRKIGLRVEQQLPFPVYYDGVVVGEYVSDVVVENQVIVEVKAVSGFESVFTAVCINYLRCSKLRRSLLLNFGRPKIEIKRISL